MSPTAPRTGDHRNPVARFLIPLAGFAALVWFLVRVIPKPSRAAYPCQRAAFPLASAFVLSVFGFLGSLRLLRRIGVLVRARRRAAALLLSCGALALAGASWLVHPGTVTLAAPAEPNVPIGEPRGIHPGRVVWYHDPGATDWEGPGDGHWWEPEHTDQTAVEIMLTRTIRLLTGEADEGKAWTLLFRDFNRRTGRGDAGFIPGEKIMVKVNLVGCHYLWDYGGTDTTTYDLTSNLDYMNTSPQVMLALLRRLVYALGATQSDITIGDPLSLFPNQYHAVLATEFPDVNYLDHAGGTAEHPRLAARNSTVPLHWSNHASGVAQDYILESFANATYVINLGNFKSHYKAGVTFCAKNHYGSLLRYPTEPGFYDLHGTLAERRPDPASYRAVVDLMGHAHLGGKTVLFLIDGLYSGVHPDDSSPRRWSAEPFNGDWTSSLFASQDGVAIESVGFDLMQLEGDDRLYPQMEGVDDYLHEAALADAPPSGTFYDPDHDGNVERLPSLGAHEHWNNPVDMQYSGNLGTGAGIELVRGARASSAPGVVAGLTTSCHPNPGNPRSVIEFDLPAAGRVVVEIFDLAGRRVVTLVDVAMPAGNHEVPWAGRDDDGRDVPSATYIYRVRQGDLAGAGKIVLVR